MNYTTLFEIFVMVMLALCVAGVLGWQWWFLASSGLLMNLGIVL